MTQPIAYTAPELAQAVGVTYRQLDYWIRTGMLTSSIRNAEGSGSSRMFSVDDYVDLLVVKRLLDLGFEIAAVRPIMQAIKEDERDTQDQAAVVYDGTTTHVCATWTEARKIAETLGACTIVRPNSLTPPEDQEVS